MHRGFGSSFKLWTHDLVRKRAADISLEDWWLHSLQNLPRAQKRTKATVLIYTTWNLWKKRNRRIFERNEAEPSTVLHLVKEDVSLRFRACGGVAPLMFVKYLS